MRIPRVVGIRQPLYDGSSRIQAMLRRSMPASDAKQEHGRKFAATRQSQMRMEEAFREEDRTILEKGLTSAQT